MRKVVFSLALLAFPMSGSAQDIGAGIDIFNGTCLNCHGGDGLGGQLGPNILPKIAELNDTELVAFLRVGNPARGMPPVITALVNDANMSGLIEYLRELSVAAEDNSLSPETSLNQFASMPAIENFEPVTQETLLNPSENDWLWYSRTPDAQRFSPLKQITTENVSQLGLAWSKGLPEGLTETIPMVYNGVMYLNLPGGNVTALDATTGDRIWEYQRQYANPGDGGSSRSKTLSIFADMVYFAAPDSVMVALDARTGEVRWESEVDGRGNTSGSIVVDGKVISGGTCSRRVDCYISAHDAFTGELIWRFYTAQAPDELPGYDTWGGTPVADRLASTWGLPGGFDPESGLIYWGIANPMPITRAERHNGDAGAVSYSSPSELYSNSTVTLDPDTGELAWYYQHLPGDDWDEDMNQERIILRTPVNPDSEHVRWINPNIEPGEERDVVVNIGEGGGIWVLDKYTGEFIWASPFPFKVDNFILSDIDVETGQTFINRDLVHEEPGSHHVVCYFNTRSYWPSSYSPENNSLYVPYVRNCLNMTAAAPATATMPATRQSRIGIAEPGVDPDELNGLARVNMETGEVIHWVLGRVPTNSSILSTAGNLVFMGNINRRYFAMDAESGDILWQTVLGSPVSTSNITYSVDGRQYIAVVTGNNLSHPGLNTGNFGPIQLNLDSGVNNSIYVFALPE